jgi:four helix bundle protein
MRTHKDLKVWKDSILLAKEIYELTSTFPTQERFGIVQQMRRAVVSVACNISEGAARRGEREFLRFLYIASGSASELATQLEISRLVDIGDEQRRAQVQRNLNQVARMLRALIRSIKHRGKKAATRSTSHQSPITNH